LTSEIHVVKMRAEMNWIRRVSITWFVLQRSRTVSSYNY